MDKENSLSITGTEFKFENDFGQSPIGLAHITDDSSQLAICYGLAGFVGFVMGGWSIAAYVLFLGLNDCLFANRQAKASKKTAQESQTELLKILAETPEETLPEPSQIPWIALQQAQTPHFDIPVATSTPGFVADMAHAVRSSLIVGIPGSGKGLTTSYLISQVKKYRPELKLMATDPKADPKEAGYFTPYHAVTRFDMELLDSEDIERKLDADLKRFQSAGDDALWVIDEFATLIGLVSKKWLERFAAKIQAVVQMGDSRNRFIWIVSQTGNLSELKLQPSLRASLNLLAIVKPGSDAAIAGLVRTDLIQNHDQTRMTNMMELSPVSRAYYYGKFGKWESMVALPNLSGYDRDSRQWKDGATPLEPVSKPTEFPVSQIENAVGFSATEVKHQGDDADPILEVIENQPEGDHKSALIAAYQWAKNRQDKGKPIEYGAFKNRAKTDRKLPYWKENLDDVWEDLQRLIQ